MNSPSNTRPRFRILFVDDGTIDVPRLEDALDDEGIERTIRVATDGQTALDYLYRREEFDDVPRPDLVVVALGVPGVNGKAVLETLAEDAEFRRVPVIACADSAGSGGTFRSHDLEADGYLTAPVQAAEFVSLVRRYVDERADEGRSP